ncbi:DUF6327 family protein [Flavobacterium acetivorans]|uniref:DUF6327 family protein n=1 Tax=Flavobacterium acetivorans TaxID=2893883 RepID=UPI001E655356|nr:DUF6327 family protein [Flavobacterium sp. F-29]UFH36255.1 DUF6327 family protein [Flavobacterium sp. F-29]
MATKKYSSYAQIDRELEILKIEKEISYQKLVLSIQVTKDSFAPKNIARGLLGSFKTSLEGSYGTILNIAIPFILKWITNRKRGC